MNTATIAGIASTLIFAGSTLPMVARAVRTRDVSSYSRSHLFMTNAGNAVHSMYIASLPPGPVWLLHGMYSGVSAFMFAAHVRWSPAPDCGFGWSACTRLRMTAQRPHMPRGARGSAEMRATSPDLRPGMPAARESP